MNIKESGRAKSLERVELTKSKVPQVGKGIGLAAGAGAGLPSAGPCRARPERRWSRDVLRRAESHLESCG